MPISDIPPYRQWLYETNLGLLKRRDPLLQNLDAAIRQYDGVRTQENLRRIWDAFEAWKRQYLPNWDTHERNQRGAMTRLDQALSQALSRMLTVATTPYKSFTNVLIDGTQIYRTQVEQCLDLVAGTPTGLKLLQEIFTTQHKVTIKHTDKGDNNRCSWLSEQGAVPKLLQALNQKSQTLFHTELSNALEKAETNRLTVEHIARQLTMTLSPVTYDSAANVRPPREAIPMSGSNVKTPQDLMAKVEREVANKAQVLEAFVSGTAHVTQLPAGWGEDLVRLLRNYLTPGSGSGSTVEFNTTDNFPCDRDPAFHRLPPAVCLGHELIHAFHNAKGVNMQIRNAKGEILEEIITTGLPPYNFEEFSDDKLRTQWPEHLHLRETYL